MKSITTHYIDGAFVESHGRQVIDVVRPRAKLLWRLHQAASARAGELTAAMIEEYGGVARFASLIVQSGINAFAAAEMVLQEIPWTSQYGRYGIEAFLETQATLES
jgi:aldehyde dehydrogenase (NAD+)